MKKIIVLFLSSLFLFSCTIKSFVKDVNTEMIEEGNKIKGKFVYTVKPMRTLIGLKSPKNPITRITLDAKLISNIDYPVKSNFDNVKQYFIGSNGIEQIEYFCGPISLEKNIVNFESELPDTYCFPESISVYLDIEKMSDLVGKATVDSLIGKHSNNYCLYFNIESENSIIASEYNRNMRLLRKRKNTINVVNYKFVLVDFISLFIKRIHINVKDAYTHENIQNYRTSYSFDLDDRFLSHFIIKNFTNNAFNNDNLLLGYEPYLSKYKKMDIAYYNFAINDIKLFLKITHPEYHYFEKTISLKDGQNTIDIYMHNIKNTINIDDSKGNRNEQFKVH